MEVNLENTYDIDELSTFLIHYGEIALKKGNRKYFENALIRNIKLIAEKIGACRIRRFPGRMYLEYAKPIDDVLLLKRLSRVFGIVKIAKTICCETGIEQIKAAAANIVTKKKFKTFAVRSRRGEKKFPIRSQQINELVGSYVQSLTKAAVNLSDPEFTLYIEILDQRTFVFGDSIKGLGGLPVGISGKIACLISGGIDSPVAAWRMMKRGCLPVYVHFYSAPYTSDASKDKVIDMVSHLMDGQPSSVIYMVPFGMIQQKIVVKVPAPYRVLMYRRFMMRIAEQIAIREGALALATGEALAQVASQTLSNLLTINSVVNMPVLRPLIGMDKQEIVDEAKIIGTFDVSIEPHDDCCSFLMPPNPVTKSNLEEMNNIEKPIDINELVNLGLESFKIIAINK